ncbi:MAG: 4Fe-4S dicluster domain-containing protein [Candidatus Methanoperedens sp.]|nr:4Fe-4S dicluster domain-containing protein [Candidatus Methanoperedens sp.]
MGAETLHTTLKGLGQEVLEQTGVIVSHCYQCGKCSAGCPLSEEMDYPPSYVMRMLQTGNPALEEKILRSFTIWVCLTCEMCYSRCPMSIDIPKMMDFLREKSLKEGKTNPKAKRIIAFHKSFLDSIKYTGRLYEIGLLADYKTRTLKILQDMVLAPKMLFRGKLNIFPELIKGRSVVASIFNKSTKKN